MPSPAAPERPRGCEQYGLRGRDHRGRSDTNGSMSCEYRVYYWAMSTPPAHHPDLPEYMTWEDIRIPWSDLEF